jgi:threonine dehydrogenase-like Zn-dependent dehydrogenase
MSRTGKRVVFPEGGACEVEDFVVDEVLPANAVLVRNEVSLISPGTELSILRKQHRAFKSAEPSPWTTFPYYPGYNALGTIEALGAGVVGFEIGDRVWHPSPHATLSVCDVGQCIRVPSDIEARDAVFYGLIEIAMTAPRRAPIELGESVLVSGLGLVGMLVGRLYRISGADVAAADFSAGRLARAARMGLHPLIDLNQSSLEDWYRERPQLAPDVSVEAAGSTSNILACMRVTRPGGRVVLQGSPRQVMEIDPYADIHRKGLTIVGAHVLTVPPEVRHRDSPFLFSLCREGLELGDFRTHEVPFTSAPEIYARLVDAQDEFLGVVLVY